MKVLFKIIVFNILFSCNFQTKKNNDTDLVASIGKDKIFLSSIDSLIRSDVYQLRLKALNYLISNIIINNEAGKYRISYDSIIHYYIYDKISEPTKFEIDDFIDLNKSFKGSRQEAFNIIKSFKEQEMFDGFVDSLKCNYPIQLYLRPPYSKIIDSNKIYGVSLNKTNFRNKVDIILNFNCSSCTEHFDDIEILIAKYKERVSFRMVYLDFQYGELANLIVAGDYQNKAYEVIKDIVKNISDINESGFCERVAYRIGLEKTKFANDMYNQMLKIEVLKTRDYLFSNEVFVTPSFIVNNKLYEGQEIFEQLDFIIEDEIN